jgi:hypothetical protein
MREKISDQKKRSAILNEILNNAEIKQLLEKGNLSAAKERALKLLENKQVQNNKTRRPKN